MKELVKTPLGVFPRQEAFEKLKAAGITPSSSDGTFVPLTIEVEVWEPNPENPGVLNYVRQSTIREVYDKLKEYLPYYVPGFPDGLDYFGVSSGLMSKSMDETPFPKYHWISCFVVTGGSEGHYIHIEIIDQAGLRKTIFLGKTFEGAEKGWEVAQAISIILNA